jgi:hypothetical protein
MKVNIKLEIVPFTVPDDVALKGPPALRQDGFKPLQRYPLSALDYDSLSELCSNFRKEIFKKAGIIDQQNHNPYRSYDSNGDLEGGK